MLTDKCKKFFDIEVFSFRLYLIQIIKKKEEHVFFLAYLITNLTKVKNPSTRKEICKKNKNCFFFASKSVIMPIRPHEIVNVKTVIANIILVFLLLVKMR